MVLTTALIVTPTGEPVRGARVIMQPRAMADAGPNHRHRIHVKRRTDRKGRVKIPDWAYVYRETSNFCGTLPDHRTRFIQIEAEGFSPGPYRVAETIELEPASPTAFNTGTPPRDDCVLIADGKGVDGRLRMTAPLSGPSSHFESLPEDATYSVHCGGGRHYPPVLRTPFNPEVPIDWGRPLAVDAFGDGLDRLSVVSLSCGDRKNDWRLGNTASTSAVVEYVRGSCQAYVLGLDDRGQTAFSYKGPLEIIEGRAEVHLQGHPSKTWFSSSSSFSHSSPC